MKDAHRPRLSLAQQLFGWSAAAVLVVWLAMLVSGYRAGVKETAEVTDGQLASLGALILQRPPVAGPAAEPGTALSSAHEYQRPFGVMLTDPSGVRVWSSGPLPDLPHVPPGEAGDGDGFADVKDAQGQSWRRFTRTSADGRLTVTVVLAHADRQDLGSDVAAQIAAPALWLLPAVALLLALAVWRGLQPLRRLSHHVARLEPGQAQPLPEGRDPPEFTEVIHALNQLMAAQQTLLTQERMFASAVAHELRTPLAGLRLHLQALGEDLPPAQLRQSVQAAETAAVQASHVLDQLLALARVSPHDWARRSQPVDLQRLAAQEVDRHQASALAQGRRVSLLQPPSGEPPVVQGHPVLLGVALRNLIANALQHTPPGSWVSVQVRRPPPGTASTESSSEWEWVVRDGPPEPGAGVAGAPARQRGDGLGLGLRLVERVALLHGGRLLREPGVSGGSCFRLRLPVQPATPPDPPGPQ